MEKKDPSKAASSYQKILSEGPGSTEASSRDYEHALIGLGQVYRDAKKPQEIADLIKTSRDTFSSFAKAKTAKLGKQSSFGVWQLRANIALQSANFWTSSVKSPIPSTSKPP